ncbi:MAG: hypothetical protein AAF662_00825 [Pseudomonadota bacterium]
MDDKNSLLEDLDFAATLARDAANTPLLGGVYFLIWSGLLVPTLLVHGGVVQGWVPLDPSSIGLLWLGYAVVGITFSTVFGMRTANRPGSNTFLNRLSRASGIVLCTLIFTFATAISVAVSAERIGFEAYNLILAFAFGLNAFHLAVLGALSRKRYLRWSALMAGVAMVLTVFYCQDPVVYFIAALGVCLSMTLPGILEVRAEHRHEPVPSA